jgi:hypothetical protein
MVIVFVRQMRNKPGLSTITIDFQYNLGDMVKSFFVVVGRLLLTEEEKVRAGVASPPIGGQEDELYRRERPHDLTAQVRHCHDCTGTALS